MYSPTLNMKPISVFIYYDESFELDKQHWFSNSKQLNFIASGKISFSHIILVSIDCKSKFWTCMLANNYIGIPLMGSMGIVDSVTYCFSELFHEIL